MSLKGKAAIAGLGITKQGKVHDTNHVGFAVEAVRLALAVRSGDAVMIVSICSARPTAQALTARER